MTAASLIGYEPGLFYWKGSWFPTPEVEPLEGRRGTGENSGLIGMAWFAAGCYPACSQHGAMNCVKPVTDDEGSYWRCLADGCNIGAIWKERGDA